MINKRKFQITNNKKVLHKVNKHWVILSAFALALLGVGTTATTTIHADPITNVSTEQVQKQPQQDNRQKTQSSTPQNPKKIEQQASSMASTLMQNANQNKSSASNHTSPTPSSVSSNITKAQSTTPSQASSAQSSNKNTSISSSTSSVNSTSAKSASGSNQSSSNSKKSATNLTSPTPKLLSTPDNTQTGKYAGLNYIENNGTIEFKNGTMQPEEDTTNARLEYESDFYHNAPANISNAHTLIFDSNINSSNISDMSNMLSNNKNIKNITLNLNTSNVSGMRNMFKSDTNLTSIIFGKKFNTSSTFTGHSSDIGNRMFAGDTNLKYITINTPNAKFEAMADLPKSYQLLTNMPKDKNGHYYTNVNPVDFTKSQMGQFITTNDNNQPNPAPTYTKQINFVDKNAQSDNVPMNFNSKQIKNVQNTNYLLPNSDIPNGFVLDNQSSDTIAFKNNQPVNIYVHPQTYGMNYKYDKDDNAITFTNGTPSVELNHFIQNAPNIIKNANILTFNSDINSSDVSDMSDMLSDDPNLTEVNFENDTRNVLGMSNLFANDSKLQSVLFGYNVNTTTSSPSMSDMFKDDNNIKQINIMSPNVKLLSDSGLSNPNMYNTFTTGTDEPNPTNIADGQNHQGVFTNQITNNIIVPYPLLPKNFPNLTTNPSAFTEARFTNIPDILYNTPQDQVHNNDAVIKIFYTKYVDKNNNNAINWSDMPNKYQPISSDNPTGITNIPSQDYKIIGLYKNYTGEGNHGLSNNNGINGYQLAINSGKEHPFGSKRLHRFTPEDINGYIFRPQAHQESSYNPYNTQNNDDHAQDGLASTSITEPSRNSANGGDMYVTDIEKDDKGHVISQGKYHDTLSIVLSYMPYHDSITYQYGNHTYSSFYSDSTANSTNYDSRLTNLTKRDNNDLWTKDIPVNNDFPYGLYVTKSDEIKFYNELNQGLLPQQKYQYGRNNLIIPLHLPTKITVNYIDNVTKKIISTPFNQSAQAGTPFHFDIDKNLPNGYVKSNNSNKLPTEFTTNNQTINIPVAHQYSNVVTYTYKGKTYTGLSFQGASDKNDTGKQLQLIQDIDKNNNSDLHKTFKMPDNYNLAPMSENDKAQALMYIYNVGTDKITLPLQRINSHIYVNYIDENTNKTISKGTPAWNKIGTTFDMSKYLQNLPSGYVYAGMNAINPAKDEQNTPTGLKFEVNDQTVNILVKIPTSTITINYVNSDGSVIQKNGSDTQQVGTSINLQKYLTNIPQGYEVKDTNNNLKNVEFGKQNYTVNIVLEPKVPKTIPTNLIPNSHPNKPNTSKSTQNSNKVAPSTPKQKQKHNHKNHKKTNHKKIIKNYISHKNTKHINRDKKANKNDKIRKEHINQHHSNSYIKTTKPIFTAHHTLMARIINGNHIKLNQIPKYIQYHHQTYQLLGITSIGHHHYIEDRILISNGDINRNNDYNKHSEKMDLKGLNNIIKHNQAIDNQSSMNQQNIAQKAKIATNNSNHVSTTSKKLPQTNEQPESILQIIGLLLLTMSLGLIIIDKRHLKN